MLYKEDDLIQAVMQVVPPVVKKKIERKNSPANANRKARKNARVHWADPVVDDDLSEDEIWKMIMAVKNGGKKSLRAQWHEMRRLYVKKGNLQIYKKSFPIYLAEVDRMRNFRSLTAGAAIKSRQGKWNNLDVIIDTGAAVTLLSEKTYVSMGSPENFLKESTYLYWMHLGMA